MITEIAMLKIKTGRAADFENAFTKAIPFINCVNGYIEHELQKCMEEENKYMLIVRWQTLEDHTNGFRKGKTYPQWKSMLHHFYDPFPIAEHYYKIINQ